MIGERAGDERSWKNTFLKKYILYRKSIYFCKKSIPQKSGKYSMSVTTQNAQFYVQPTAVSAGSPL